MTIAKELMKASAERLHEPSNKPNSSAAAPQFLADAFVWRIEQAIKGKPHSGPFSPELRQRLATIDTLRSNTDIYPRYVVDQLRNVRGYWNPR